jgi:hypothetical protein
MGLDVTELLTATVDTDEPLTLHLAGPWLGMPQVTVDGVRVEPGRDGRVVTVSLLAGSSEVELTPRGP